MKFMLYLHSYIKVFVNYIAISTVSGISYQDEEATGWFDWFDGYRSLMVEGAIDKEVLPLLTQQGVVPNLGMILHEL
jgi:hypothetical protein